MGAIQRTRAVAGQCRCSGENEASIENGCRQSSLCDTQEYCRASIRSDKGGNGIRPVFAARVHSSKRRVGPRLHRLEHQKTACTESISRYAHEKCRQNTSRLLGKAQSKPINADRTRHITCLLYTSDAADEEDSVDLGGRRIIKKKK